jgi:hypothetical protein
VRGFELTKEVAGRCRGGARESEKQLSLRSKSLRQRARRHARFGRDLGERELTRGKPVRRAMGRGEDLLVADLSRAGAHGLDVSKRSYSLKLNANVV